MQAPHLSLPALLGLNMRTYHDLGQIADSAAHIVAQEDVTEEQRAKLNIILGYVSAKTGKWGVAAHHYMSAFKAGRASKLNIQLVMTAGIGVVLALMRQQDYLRAKHVVSLLEATVDGSPDATATEGIMLDQLLEQITWRLGDVS